MLLKTLVLSSLFGAVAAQADNPSAIAYLNQVSQALMGAQQSADQAVIYAQDAKAKVNAAQIAVSGALIALSQDNSNLTYTGVCTSSSTSFAQVCSGGAAGTGSTMYRDTEKCAREKAMRSCTENGRFKCSEPLLEYNPVASGNSSVSFFCEVTASTGRSN